MGYRILWILALLCIGGVTLPAPAAVGAEPKVEELIQQIPILTAENDSLQSFSFKGEFVTPFGVPAVFEACWARDQGFGFALVDQFDFPVLFIAQQQMMLYDASEGLLTLGEDCNPKVILQVKEARSVAFCGVESSAQVPFVVDIPSFIRQPADATRTFGRLPNGLWELRDLHKKGSELRLLFDAAEPWPLKRMEVRLAGEPIVIVREIRINSPVPSYLTKFPAVDAFPAELATDRLTEHQGDDLNDAFSLPQRFVRSLATPSAIRDAKLRSFPFAGDVNWAEVERRHQVVGPKLSKLLEVQIEGRTLK